MRRLIIGFGLIFGILGLVIGCTRDDRGTGSSTGDHEREAVSLNPSSSDCSGGEFQLLSSEVLEINGSEDPRFAQALSYGEVQATIAMFEDKGYVFDRVNSFLMEGDGVAEDSYDTLKVLLVNLIMRNVADSMRDFVQVAYLAGPGRPDIVPVVRTAVYSLVRPASDFASYEEFLVGYDDWGSEVYVWAKDWIPPFGPGEDNAVFAKPAWCWKCWAKCTLSGFVGGCATGAVRCLLTGPGALQCSAIACGASAVGSALGCAAGQLLN